MYLLISGLIISLILAVIYGTVTKYMNEGKGYTGGFAWGFWLGIIGIIVVACKPQNIRIYTETSESHRVTWKCLKCGRINADYVTTCICGNSKENNRSLKPVTEIKTEQIAMSSADEIVKFKKLLDAGAITQEEYDAKKRKILNI